MKNIFDLIKDGDAIIFQARGLKKYPIKIGSGGKWTHCGTAWLVERKENEVSFNFSEQTTSGGKFNRVTIRKVQDMYFAEGNDRFNESKLMLKQIPIVSEEQLKAGLEDAIKENGKKYGFLSLILGAAFFEKIFPEKLRNKIGFFLKKSARVCSTHTAIQWSKMGLIEFKREMFWTPTDIAEVKW